MLSSRIGAGEPEPTRPPPAGDRVDGFRLRPKWTGSVPCVETPADVEPLSCSVVVPVRDDAAELRGLLAALAQQTEPPLELIVVDNGSQDEGAALASTAGCTVITHPEPSIAAAAAAGYDRARGDLIVRCDADSRPPPGWLRAHRLAHTRAGSATALVTGPGRFRLSFPLGGILSGLYVGAYLLSTAAALGHFPAFGTTMSMRRSWWQQVREETSRSAEVHDDMDLSFRVRPEQRVRVTRTVTVGMSIRALQLSRDPLRRWRRAVSTLRRNWRLERPWERWATRLSVRRPGR